MMYCNVVINYLIAVYYIFLDIYYKKPFRSMYLAKTKPKMSPCWMVKMCMLHCMSKTTKKLNVMAKSNYGQFGKSILPLESQLRFANCII